LTIVCLGGFANDVQSHSRRPYRVFMTTQYLMNISIIAALGMQLSFG
jgi:hypothetical protein